VFPCELTPLYNLPAARLGPAPPICGALVPVERLWATQRPRSGGIQAPRTVERRAGRMTAPAGSCRCAMGGGAARPHAQPVQARARLWRRAIACGTMALRDLDEAQHDRTAPPRRARIAGGEIELTQSCAPLRRARCAGFGQSVSRASCTPRPPGCVPWPSHAPALVSRGRVADLHKHVRTFSQP
jgi:hypothetical protein